MSNMHEIKDRIRKLLNLANDHGAQQGEIDNALRFARRLMLDNQLSEEDLGKDPHDIAAEVEYSLEQVGLVGRRISCWESELAHVICKLVGGVGHYSCWDAARTREGTLIFDRNGQKQFGTVFKFYGAKEDVSDTTQLYQEWAVTISACARMRYGGALRGAGKDYASGFVRGMWNQLTAILQQEQIESETSTALTVRREVMLEKRKLALAWLKDVQGVVLHNRAGHSNNINDRNAYGSGLEHGARANLSRKVTKKLSSG